MKTKLPELRSDEEAEEFVANSDLTEYDLSAMWTVRFEFQSKSERVLHRVLPDGTEQPMPPSPPMRPMTEAEIEAAALRDPDAQPLTNETMATMRRVPRAKTLRRALGLTQEEFATRFQIPLGTLRDWEQGRTEPDQPARAYLKVIACDPEAVQRALDSAMPELR